MVPSVGLGTRPPTVNSSAGIEKITSPERQECHWTSGWKGLSINENRRSKAAIFMRIFPVEIIERGLRSSVREHELPNHRPLRQ